MPGLLALCAVSGTAEWALCCAAADGRCAVQLPMGAAQPRALQAWSVCALVAACEACVMNGQALVQQAWECRP